MGVKPIVKREALVFGLNLPCLFVIDTTREEMSLRDIISARALM